MSDKYCAMTIRLPEETMYILNKYLVERKREDASMTKNSIIVDAICEYLKRKEIVNE